MRRSTVLAVAVFVVLLLAVLLVQRSDMERGAEILDLTSLDPAAVDGLTIQEGGTAVELARADGTWRLESGRLADRAAIERALEGLAEVASSDVVSSSAERHGEYGVGEDAARVTLRTDGGTAAKLVLGGPARSGGSYLREAGADTVFRVSRSLRHLFPTDRARWIQLRLVDAELEDVAKVRLELVGAEPYELVPAEAGDEWAIADPDRLPSRFRFDGPGALRLARTAVTLRAKELVEDPPPADQTGLEAEHDRVVISTGDADHVVHLGATAEDDTVWARVDGRDAVFRLHAFQADTLRTPLVELRDLRVLRFDPERATGLELAWSGERLAFERGPGGEWAPAGDAPPPENLDLDPLAVQRTVASLAALQAQGIDADVSPARAGLDRPSAVATVILDDGSTAMLELGRPGTADERTFYWARGTADDHIYRVAEYHHGQLTRGWEAFRRVEPPPRQGGNPFANLDPETLKKLPPEIREQVRQQMEQERRKQELLRQLQQQDGG